MNTKEIALKIRKLGTDNEDYTLLLENVIKAKRKFAEEGNEFEAKKFWIFEQITEIHRDFNLVFNSLKGKNYFEAWCKMESIEITFHFLKRHLSYNKSEYKLYYIEKAIRNLQMIFPYRIFSSIELLEKEKKCNICDKVVTIRNQCGHRTGEIYGGELCLRIVTQCEIIGIALVENPVNKYTVAFTVDPVTNEKIDQYNYESLDYLMDIIKTPFEQWDLNIHSKYLPHSEYSEVKQDDFCPCTSGEKYKDCCLKREGVKYIHFEYIVKIPIPKSIMSTTKKKFHN